MGLLAKSSFDCHFGGELLMLSWQGMYDDAPVWGYRTFDFRIGKDYRQLGCGLLNCSSWPLIYLQANLISNLKDLEFKVYSTNKNLHSRRSEPCCGKLESALFSRRRFYRRL